MKTITCQHCQEQFEAETVEEMMGHLMTHYKTSHQDVMASGNKEEQEQWMARFNKEWAEA